MANTQKLFVLCMLLVLAAAAVRHRGDGYAHHHDEDESEHHHKRPSPFVLKEPVQIAKTEAGEIRVLPGPDEAGVLAANHIGLSIISMEPKALLLPQYLDASCVMYVHKGQLTLGWVEEGKLSKQNLTTGDIYALPGGLVFYILNTDEGQRLRVFAMCDTSESLEPGHFQSSFLGGGEYPRTILSGFDKDILAAAFKVAPEDIEDLTRSQNKGPILYTSSRSELRQTTNDGDNEQSPKPFNLLKKTPDIQNDNGWSIAVHGEEFSPLQDAGVGVFAVSLKPGALLAPHWNPRASEVAFVTEGQGRIQVSYPNGTNALNKRVDEGTVFFVPRYFPMSQIASRDGPFEFVGFSTSSRPNCPQFLAGSSSVLKAVEGDIMSKAFNISEERLKTILGSQPDGIILSGFIEEEEDAPKPRYVVM